MAIPEPESATEVYYEEEMTAIQTWNTEYGMVAAILRSRMEQFSLNTADVAKLTGTSKTFIKRVLAKKQDLKMKHLYKIAFALELVPTIGMRTLKK